MDTNEQSQTSETRVAKLELTGNSVNNLNQMRKWTMFLSIMGFIGTGAILLIAILMFSFSHLFPMFGNRLGHGFGVILGFLYVVIAVLYFFPVLYLYKFSARAKKAFKTVSSLDLENSIKYLNTFFTLKGIYTIILIGIYVLVILGVTVFRLALGKI
jgi:hypothetical protein